MNNILKGLNLEPEKKTQEKNKLPPLNDSKQEHQSLPEQQAQPQLPPVPKILPSKLAPQPLQVTHLPIDHQMNFHK